MKALDYKLYLPTYKLILRLFIVVNNFPKTYRYTLGDKCINTGLNLVGLCIDSDLKYIKEYKEELLKLIILFRLGKDLKIIPLKLFSLLAQLIQDIKEIIMKEAN